MWLRQESICCSAGDPLSIPGSGRSSGEGNDNPLQDSCLENLMDRGAWLVTVNGVTKSQTHTLTFSHLGMVWGDWMALRGSSVPLWASYRSGDRGLAGGLAWVTSRPRTRAHRPCSSILSKPCHLPSWENQDCPGSILDSMLKRSKDIGPLSVSFFFLLLFPP